MAEMGGAHSQTSVLALSSSLYLIPLEDNRSSQIKQNPKRKLEDYLDPVLLHTISSRIGRTETKEKQMERKDVFVNTNPRKEFDWPVDRLDPLINDPNRDTARGHSGEKTAEHGILAPTIPSLSKRRRSAFPIWMVKDNKLGAG
ncbi:uncharacterized protein LOC112082360 isoform X2 [Eutrema salsugineum]|uniref:uncharacterized protein LOC112082360 isoform X2 n=1 Tax=Eutrema salsugineum TaxID=72664 RepID=UPI000CED4771|nr:uncharacterized protein LOC112082360 isoform X2 [Eutrema salsugineum]